MKLKANFARSAALAISLSSFQPMLEGCAGRYPPVAGPLEDGAVAVDGGRRGGRDGGIRNMPDGGTCLMDSERLYEGGGPVAFDGELFVLESAAGYSAQISISDPASGASTFVSIPQWGSQTVNLAGKRMTITVNEMSEGPPSWADVDLSGC